MKEQPFNEKLLSLSFFLSFYFWHKEIQNLKENFVFPWPKFKAKCDLDVLFLMVLVRKWQATSFIKSEIFSWALGGLILILLQGYISQDLILHINADRRQSSLEHLTCLSCFMPGFSVVAWSDIFVYKSVPREVVCLPLALTQSWHWIFENPFWKVWWSHSSFLYPGVRATLALRWDLGGQVLSWTHLPLLSPGVRMVTLPLPSAKIWKCH